MRRAVDPRLRGSLAMLMTERGTSQRQLAAAAAVSPSYLSEVLNGLKMPSLDVASALERALGVTGVLTGLIPLGVGEDDRGRLADAVTHPRRIDQAVVGALTRTLAAQRELDDTLGSAALIAPTTAQLDTITRMANEAIGPTRGDILHVAAQWAQFTGWLAISTARWSDARAWLSRATLWVAETGDPDLTATILSYQAHVAWLTHQLGPVVGLAEAALRDPTVYPGQRAYDAYQAARGYAAYGNLDAAQRMLTCGNDLAQQSDTHTGPLPAWQYYRAPWMWQAERGLVQLTMAAHDPRWSAAAVGSLRAGTAGIPAEMRGADWAAEYQAHLATALMRVGELDEASMVLDAAGQVAEATRSERVTRLVQGRERRLLQLRG